MKIIKSISPFSKLPAVPAFLFALVMLASCSTKRYNFSTSSVVPAAEGRIKVKMDGNSNYKIDLNISGLADANRLSPSKKMYIVWMETENGRKNIGQLNTSTGLFSKALKSSLNTVTPYKPTGFFITAEDDANIQYPGDFVVLTTGMK